MLLSEELQDLVHRSVAILGSEIKRQWGTELFQEVESLRIAMKAIRGKSEAAEYRILNRFLKQLRLRSSEDRLKIAHSYSLMLELMNRAENAYRTYRLRARKPYAFKTKITMTFVFTAHPTEARSPHMLEIFERVHNLLIEGFETHFGRIEERLRAELALALYVPMAPAFRPEVKDEASSLYRILLKRPILESLLELNEEGHRIYFRTWVGGDKDGHPGVNEKTLIESLSLSRARLLQFLEKEVLDFESRLGALAAKPSSISQKLSALRSEFKSLEKIKEGDAHRVLRLKAQFENLGNKIDQEYAVLSSRFQVLRKLFSVFPALVVPLEIREHRAQIEEALAKPDGATIVRMLKKLRSLGDSHHLQSYVQGFVISMVESEKDLWNAYELTKKHLGMNALPIIPLFENHHALLKGSGILEKALAHPPFLKSYLGRRKNTFEVMLGYSDSAKELGPWLSRILIARAMHDIDQVLRRFKLTPQYFHGSGGSVERGGGSVQEQIEWWPQSALGRIKLTIQGEMVQRSLASPEIFLKNLEIFDQQMGLRKAKSPQKTYLLSQDFAERSSQVYKKTVHDPDFLKVLNEATLYPYLKYLRIGSRPSKRKRASVQVEDLRAIPWVMCWTQNRALFPAWWGVGSVWKSATQKERLALQKAFQKDPLFRSFVKNLGFSLRKIKMGVFHLYLDQLIAEPKLRSEIFERFQAELKNAEQFVRGVSQQNDLLWFRPWLSESIRLRASMIDPLNILQILAIQEKDHVLLRESVTGIAAGMLTTG